jgi:hypothetical protein
MLLYQVITARGSLFLIIAALAAFLIRQPVTTAVKIYSGRRNRRELPAAWFWIGIYGLIGALGLVGLVIQGFAYLFILVLPGIPVFIWHLYLVSKRAERRQLGVEVVGSGVLALAAPAGYWIGVGSLDPIGWLLLALTWLQSAASIVYAYLRLGQRDLPAVPAINERVRMGRRALIYTTFNIIFVAALSVANLVSPLLTIRQTSNCHWFPSVVRQQPFHHLVYPHLVIQVLTASHIRFPFDQNYLKSPPTGVRLTTYPPSASWTSLISRRVIAKPNRS